MREDDDNTPLQTADRLAPAHSAVAAQAPFSLMLMITALLILLGFGAAAAIWLTRAPISSAVIAPGIVSVDSYRKQIQHLEGGIVDHILVKNGDRVHSGQVLVKLRDVSAAAEVARLRAQYYEIIANIAQATAERDGAAEISFPDELRMTPEPAARAAMRAQKRVFDSRRELVEHSLSVIRQKILQTEEEIAGFEGQVASVNEQLKYFDLEVKDAEQLYRKNLLAKPRLLKLQRERAQLQGRLSELNASIARIRQMALELELKSTELRHARVVEAVETFRAQRTRAFELSRSLQAAEDILTRTEITAPIEGTIVGLQVHTRDGVVRAGQTIMEIVPSSDQLVIEARIRPEQREDVSAGLKANVKLASQSPRDSQPIAGVLQSVSADRLTDPTNGEPFYLVRVLLDETSLEAQNSKLLAGMAAEVFIQTGQRTPMQYLVDPILRTLSRSLREK